MRIQLCKAAGKSIRLGWRGEALLLNERRRRINAVLTKQPDRKIQMIKGGGGHIIDFRAFGDAQDLVATLTDDGWIAIHQFDFDDFSTKVVSTKRLELYGGHSEASLDQNGAIGGAGGASGGVREKAAHLAVCEKSHFVQVVLEECETKRLSRLLVYELSDGCLQLRSSLKLGEEQVPNFDSFVFYGYFGIHLVSVGIGSVEETSTLMIFDYNTRFNDLVEVVEKRNEFEFLKPLKMSLVAGRVYASDMNGRIVDIKLET